MPGRQIPTNAVHPRRLTLSLALAATVSLVAGVPVSAATVSNTWSAKIGSAGVNGTAKVTAFGSGTGSVALKLLKLKPSSLLPVVISKGTCGAVGTTVATLASIRTSSAGAAARTSTLTAAQTKAINAATNGTGRIAIRVGSGTTRKCGLFAVPTPLVAATIQVGAYPADATIDPSGVWVVNSVARTASRIDPKTNTVLSAASLVGIEGNTLPWAITSGFGSIWVSILAYDDTGVLVLNGSVLRIDPVTGLPIGTPIPVGKGPLEIAASPEAIWVTNYEDATVSRIDPLMNAVSATILVGARPFGVAAGFGSIWVSSEADGKVARIDPLTNTVTTSIPTVGVAEGIMVGAGSVWVTNYGTEGVADGVLSRIDPAINSVVATIPVGTNPIMVAFGGGSVWVGLFGEPTVVQVDPATNTVKKRIAVGATSWGIAATDHVVWAVHPTAAGNDPKNFTLPGTVTRISF